VVKTVLQGGAHAGAVVEVALAIGHTRFGTRGEQQAADRHSGSQGYDEAAPNDWYKRDSRFNRILLTDRLRPRDEDAIGLGARI
jgi:hypothetical protein